MAALSRLCHRISGTLGWRAYTSPDGDPYFFHVASKTTTWEIPGVPRDSREEMLRDCAESDRKWLEVGAAVVMHSLTEDDRYNNQT